LFDKVHHEKENPVLKDFNLTVQMGDSIGIMGKSGCGKTTLLKILGTIDRATRGEVTYGGVSVKKISDSDIAELRRKQMGFVFQDYNLFSHLTVEENIMLPLILDKRKTSEMRDRVWQNADFLNISSILKKYPYEISGGEKQRTAIARALVNDPQIIFGDEPTGNLDSASTTSIMNYLDDINRIKGKALVIVTHDALVASYCKRIIFIKDGRMEKTIENGQSKVENMRKITDIMLNL
jgi:ABC-type lipoprotein export system ATPase subunit